MSTKRSHIFAIEGWRVHIAEISVVNLKFNYAAVVNFLTVIMMKIHLFKTSVRVVAVETEIWPNISPVFVHIFRE